MSDRILIGRGREVTSIPRREWEERLSQIPGHMKTRLSFMTAQQRVSQEQGPG